MPFGSMDELEEAFRDVAYDLQRQAGSVENLLNNRQLNAILQSIVASLEQLGINVAEALPQLITEEYAAGSDLAVTQLAQAGIIGGALDGGLNTDFKRQIHVEAVQELILDTGNDLQAAIRTAMFNGTNGITNIVNNVTTALGKSLITGSPRKVAQREVARLFANEGLTSFVTRDGKRLPLSFYAQTVTRTKRKDANVKGQVNRYTENGVKYVKILPHAPACHICSGHFGVIIQISGEIVAGVPHISNTKLPPFHPNCKCSMVPILSLDGEAIIQPAAADNRTEAQRRAYNAEQKIRRRANKEMKLYQKMQAEGVEVPASIGAFRRQIRKNDQPWKDLQEEYRRAIQTNAAQTSSDYSFDPPRRMADRAFIEQWRQNKNVPKQRETILSRDTLGISWNVQPRGNGNEYLIDINGEKTAFTVNDKAHEASVVRRLEKIRDHKRSEFDFSFQDSLREGTPYDYDLAAVFDKLYYQYKAFDNLYKMGGFDIALNNNRAEELGKGLNGFNKAWTKLDVSALKYYTGSAYSEINQALRTDRTKEAREEVIKKIKQMDKAFKKTTLQEDMLVVRGSGYQAIGSENYVKATSDPSILVGMEIYDKGYMSTSISTGGAFSGDIQLQIMLPKGTTNVAYVSDISSYRTEFELLLNRGTKLRVIKADKIGNTNSIKLLCEVIANEPTKL